MDFDTRVNRISTLIAAAGGRIETRKKLHKLAFLCQSAGDDLSQDFDFDLYEVTSPSLSADVEKALSVGSLSLGKEDDVLLLEVSREFKPDTDLLKRAGYSLVNELKDRSLPMLEVLSTIVYLNSVGYAGNLLGTKLLELKGQHKQALEEAVDLAKRYFGIECQLPAVSAGR